ncbi:hypothetical protein [Candidatus Hodgkinia cicadicola]|uniref:hypothetical protein n=1 Tax=Candidatus Hodgkinia cicadicola TaxID=573658 RepID=UPI001788D3CE
MLEVCMWRLGRNKALDKVCHNDVLSWREVWVGFCFGMRLLWVLTHIWLVGSKIEVGMKEKVGKWLWSSRGWNCWGLCD